MDQNISYQKQNFLKKLIDKKNTNGLSFLGKLFNTELNNYFYDNGTGKVIVFDDEIYNIFQLLLEDNRKLDFNDFINCNYNFSKSALHEFLTLTFQENLLQAPEINKIYSYQHHEGLEYQINNNLQQIILELTGRCNLRCGYCVYNDDYKHNRCFNQKDMTENIAKLAIDYAKIHSQNKLSITFYGGEPLIKFDLLKWCIEYSLANLKDKELTFSLTTNLTLVTDEIANYLASVPNLSVVCSIDGPSNVHNAYRKFVDGKGSFDKAILGLEKLSDAFSKTNNYLAINVVYAPPYNYKKLDEIKNFFDNLDFLPRDTNIQITYPTKDSVVNEYKAFEEISHNPKYWSNNNKTLDPLWIWNKKQVILADRLDEGSESQFIGSNVRDLVRIHHRFISDKASNIYPQNSCCVPGSRRLYVDTSGDFYVCERIGSSPSIGSVFLGVNIDKIKKYYVDEYEQNSLDCANCWAIRICNTCYANIYNQEGFDKKARDELCKINRVSALQSLILYYSIYELFPEKLNGLNNWEIS